MRPRHGPLVSTFASAFDMPGEEEDTAVPSADRPALSVAVAGTAVVAGVATAVVVAAATAVDATAADFWMNSVLADCFFT